MIIIRTPFRVSFFGGATDFPSYYRKHGGLVVGTAINRYSYVSVRNLPPFFDYRIRLSYSKIETLNNYLNVEHTGIKEAFKYMGGVEDIEVSHTADLPGRSGIGSSSTFIVGLLHALYRLRQSTPSKFHLAEATNRIERVHLNEPGGHQDPLFAAFGGICAFEFDRAGEIFHHPIDLIPSDVRKLTSSTMLFYTGIARTSGEVTKTYKPTDAALHRIKSIADQGYLAMLKADIPRIGDLLDQSWNHKRSLSPEISNSEIDKLYERAKKVGAIGGKIIGAGGGGFMMLVVEPNNQQAVRDLFKSVNMLEIPFGIDMKGSTVLYENEHY